MTPSLKSFEHRWVAVKVVGVSFCAGYPGNLHALAAAHADLEIGDDCIELRRNPHNKYDSNAIEVRLSTTEEMLGHIPKDLAARIAPDIDDGGVWEAEFASVYVDPHHSDRPGLEILIKKGPST